MSHVCDGRDESCGSCAEIVQRREVVRAAMTLGDRLDDIKRAQIWTRLDRAIDTLPVRRLPWRPAAALVACAAAAVACWIVVRRAPEPRAFVAPADSTLTAQVGPHTRAELIGPARLELDGPPGDATHVRLRAGTLVAEFTGGPGRSLRIEAPGAVIQIVGTLFSVEVAGNQTCVSVAHGKVAVTTPTGALAIGTGESWCTARPQIEALPAAARVRFDRFAALAVAIRAPIVTPGGVVPPGSPPPTMATPADVAATDAPHVDAPHADAPHADAPHADAPHADAPHADAPHAEPSGAAAAPFAPPRAVASRSESSRAEPSSPDSSRAEPSRAGAAPLAPPHAGSSGVEPSSADSPRADPSRVEPSRVEPSRVEPSRVEPSRVEPSRVEPSRVGPSHGEPPHAAPWRAGALATAPSPSAAAPSGAPAPAPSPSAVAPRAAPAPAEPVAGPAATPESLYKTAETALAGRDTAGADRALAALVAGFADSPLVDQALYERARIAYQRHAWSDARRELAKLAEKSSSPLVEPGAYLACRIAVESHDDGAAHCLSSFRRTYPSSPHDLDVLGLLVDLAYRNGGCRGAAHAIDALARRHPDSALSRAWHARCEARP